jgi:hypothetical protein
VSRLVKPLAVQDVFNVFSDKDPTNSPPAAHVLIELLTSDGLLILQVPKPMARELGENLSRISLEPDAHAEQAGTRASDLRR